MEDPFVAEDLQQILHEESCNDASEGWEFVKSTELAEIWRKTDDNSPIQLIKGYLRFPGIPPKDVIKLIADLDVRMRWETRFPVIDIVEEFPKYKIVYWLVKMPFGVANRDLLQYISHRRDEEKNLHYILYKNATDERRPEVPGVVRAKTILSGVLIRPEESDPSSTKLTILLQNDPMGWIPKSIVNLLSSRAPIEWQESMASFYHNIYVKEIKKKEEENASTNNEA